MGSGIVHFNKSQPSRAGAQIQVQLVLGMPDGSIDQPLVAPVPVVFGVTTLHTWA